MQLRLLNSWERDAHTSGSLKALHGGTERKIEEPAEVAGIAGKEQGEEMKVRKILGKNRFETFSKTRYAARAVITENDRILLVHDLKNDVYMLPGGGLEEGETLEQCCIREVGGRNGPFVQDRRLPCSVGGIL